MCVYVCVYMCVFASVFVSVYMCVSVCVFLCVIVLYYMDVCLLSMAICVLSVHVAVCLRFKCPRTYTYSVKCVRKRFVTSHKIKKDSCSGGQAHFDRHVPFI